MNFPFTKQISWIAIVCLALAMASTVHAQQVVSVTTFASGIDVSASQPDSITLTKNSVWVEYSNGADSTGLFGSSTIVQYNLKGEVRYTYTIPGNVDGLKVDPNNGLIWALQNQDGNSTLSLIDPVKHTVIGPIPYAVTSSTRGYDDVAFIGNKVYLSYTNPVQSTDPTIQLLQNGSDPLVVSNILLMGATGTNLATGQSNEPISDTDPDSLKVTPAGDLMLTGEADGQLIFVRDPGPNQSVSFLQLIDPTSGGNISGIDDAVIAIDGSGKATFYLADTGNNRVLKIKADHVAAGTLFCSISSLNYLGLVDWQTGVATPFVSDLNGPHGLELVGGDGD